jgi:hypothetical protein
MHIHNNGAKAQAFLKLRYHSTYILGCFRFKIGSQHSQGVSGCRFLRRLRLLSEVANKQSIVHISVVDAEVLRSDLGTTSQMAFQPGRSK